MSTSAPPAPERAAVCPRCGSYVVENQDWCLNCGDAARTRLVPTPNWRLPLLLAGLIGALALLVIAISFVQLTRDDAPVTQTTTAPATTAPPPPVTTAPPAATVPPTTTIPGATGTAPGATPTAPGATAPAPGATAPTPGATATTPGATATTPGATTTP